MKKSCTSKDFNNIRNQYPVCKVLLRDCDEAYSAVGNIEMDSICLRAYKSGYLDRLSNIFVKFELEQNISKDYRERLNESFWLKEQDNGERLNKHNRIISVFVELLVAEYLEKEGEQIINLAAWKPEVVGNSAKCDIESKEGKTSCEYVTEVKYLGFEPGSYQLLCDTIQTGPTTRWCSSNWKAYNYLLTRIADAVYQLTSENVSIANRRVFIVIDSESWGLLVKMGIPDMMRKKRDWFEGRDKDCLFNKLNLNDKKRIWYKKPATEFFKEAGCFVLGYLTKSLDLGIQLTMS